jgi:hypothetical protein
MAQAVCRARLATAVEFEIVIFKRPLNIVLNSFRKSRSVGFGLSGSRLFAFRLVCFLSGRLWTGEHALKGAHRPWHALAISDTALAAALEIGIDRGAPILISRRDVLKAVYDVLK